MGLRILLLSPEIAGRSCADCQRWQYQDSPDQMAAEPVVRAGKRLKRVGRTPCRWCPKQPPDVEERDRRPGTAIELSAKNWQAWQHYKECKITGRWPNDPIVIQNAAIIADAEKLGDDVRQIQLAGLMRRR